jgi:hypothetical protein
MRPVRKRSTAFSGRSTSSPAFFGGTRSAMTVKMDLDIRAQSANR